LINFEEINQKNKIVLVLKVIILWDLGSKADSIQLFKECIEINKMKALELFEINPNLKTVSEFVLLANN
jgi:hypothetical protein